MTVDTASLAVADLGYPANPWRIVTPDGDQVTTRSTGWRQWGWPEQHDADVALAAIRAGALTWAGWSPGQHPSSGLPLTDRRDQ